MPSLSPADLPTHGDATPTVPPLNTPSEANAALTVLATTAARQAELHQRLLMLDAERAMVEAELNLRSGSSSGTVPALAPSSSASSAVLATDHVPTTNAPNADLTLPGEPGNHFSPTVGSVGTSINSGSIPAPNPPNTYASGTSNHASLHTPQHVLPPTYTLFAGLPPMKITWPSFPADPSLFDGWKNLFLAAVASSELASVYDIPSNTLVRDTTPELNTRLYARLISCLPPSNSFVQRASHRGDGLQLWRALLSAYAPSKSLGYHQAKLAEFWTTLSRAPDEDIYTYYNRFDLLVSRINTDQPTPALSDAIVRKRFLLTLGSGFEYLVHDDNNNRLDPRYTQWPWDVLLDDLQQVQTTKRAQLLATPTAASAGYSNMAHAATQPPTEPAVLTTIIAQLAALTTAVTKLNTAPARAPPTFYCHTHGLCHHTSAQCKNKAEGHQDLATLDTQLGGSTRGVPRHKKEGGSSNPFIKIKSLNIRPLEHLLPRPPSIFSPTSSPAIFDSGCSAHYLTQDFSASACPTFPISITLADGHHLASDHITQLPVASSTLPPDAITAHVVPQLSTSLLSIGQLCDHGCTAVFDRATANIYHNHQLVMSGARDPLTRLWNIDLPHPPSPATTATLQQPLHACYSINPRSTIAQRIAYYHACCFSPPLSTWCTAIDAGFFTTFPELTSALVRKYPPSSMAMHKGHLDQTRANLRSTQPKPVVSPRSRPHELFLGVVDAPELPAKVGVVYSDSTGQFLVPSSRGNSYLLIVFDASSNYIFAEAMPSRSAGQILKAYDKVHTLLENKGLKPHLHIIDNEASALLKSYLTKNDVAYQLVPPNVHRANAAERAIQTFKHHFIAGLCSLDPEFPLHLWDRLLPQAVITLNLLRTSAINPQLSAYAQIHGAFDFNRTPLGPPGTRVLVHDKPTQRGTWAPHGVEGWYTGPAMEHYRCFTTYTPSTNAERITDTLAWFPSQLIMPTASSTDAAFAAAADLVKALLHPSPASALSPLTDSERTALSSLAIIFASRFLDTDHLPATPSVELPPTTPVPTSQPRVAPLPPTESDAPSVPIDGLPVPPSQPRVEPLPPTEYDAPRVTLHMPPSAPTPPQTPESTTHHLDDTHPRVDAAPSTTTYASINHNPAQRRRQQRTTRQQFSGPTCPVSADEDTVRTSHVSSRAPLTTAASSQDSPSPPTDSSAASALATVPPPRRSPRGSKILRFDPRTHKLIPRPVASRATSIQHTAHSAVALPHRKLIQGDHADMWLQATAMEFGRLAQGLTGSVDGTDTIFFIPHTAKPADRKATYVNIVCAHNANKVEPYRVRLTAGGDQVDYPGYVSTPTVDITTVKIHLNAVLSTPGARYMTFDLKNFYLNTPLDRYEYMRIPVTAIPPSIMEQYQLAPLIHNGYVMVEIRKGIYGLPQAGILANELLIQRLALGGYHPAPHTPGLFLHATRKISFTLWVDDFGVNYIDPADVEHLLRLLEQHYTMTTDWSGTKYLGLTLKWDYDQRTVDLSMPGYIQRTLERFQHPLPTRPQHSPHAWTAPTFGSGAQYTSEPTDSPPLSPTHIKRLQQIIGVLLYYARMVDNTLLVALGTLAAAQSKGTEATMDAAVQLLNYCATHPNATIRYRASDMILHIVSDASYLSASESRSRLGGYFFLSKDIGSTAPLPDDPPPPFNAPILVNSSILQTIVSSAAEAELGALFYNAKDGCMLRTTLIDLGYPQPATPIEADNACAVGLANDTVKQRRSKAIDMRFYWVKDRVKAGQFLIYWRRGSDNDADYFTKHHPPSHHRLKRSRYLHVPPPE